MHAFKLYSFEFFQLEVLYFDHFRKFGALLVPTNFQNLIAFELTCHGYLNIKHLFYRLFEFREFLILLDYKFHVSILSFFFQRIWTNLNFEIPEQLKDYVDYIDNFQTSISQHDCFHLEESDLWMVELMLKLLGPILCHLVVFNLF